MDGFKHCLESGMAVVVLRLRHWLGLRTGLVLWTGVTLVRFKNGFSVMDGYTIG